MNKTSITSCHSELQVSYSCSWQTNGVTNILLSTGNFHVVRKCEIDATVQLNPNNYLHFGSYMLYKLLIESFDSP